MPANAAHTLNIKNPLGGDATKRPPRDRRLVDAKRQCQIDQAKALGAKLSLKMRPVHDVDSCVTCNKGQQQFLRNPLTTEVQSAGMFCEMNITRIHKDKQPMRPHHIADWAEMRGMSQSDLAESLGADKSVISQWFNGSTPSTKWQEALAEVLDCGSPESLFRHPDDDWIAQFFKNRDKAEIDRIKATLETAFPRKAG